MGIDGGDEDGWERCGYMMRECNKKKVGKREKKLGAIFANGGNKV